MTGRKSTIVGLEDFFDVRGELQAARTDSPEKTDDSDTDESASGAESGASEGSFELVDAPGPQSDPAVRKSKRDFLKAIKRRRDTLRRENAVLDDKIAELEEEKDHLIQVEKRNEIASAIVASLKEELGTPRRSERLQRK